MRLSAAVSATIVSLLFLTRAGAAQQVLELRPNLKAFPASELAVITDSTGAANLVFGATSWNSGQGPLELIAGTTVPGDPTKQYVYQRVYLTDGGYYDRLAGTFEYHPTHFHFHFEDYATYTLTPVDSSTGAPRQSTKVSFCIEDTTKVNTKLPGSPNRAVYVTCNPYVQGMSVGWGDRYGPTLPGQSIDISGYPEGDYELTIRFDPDDRLLETDNSDNSACELLHISAAAGLVQVLGGCGMSAGTTITSVEPNSAAEGSVVDVTISGTGFAAGMTIAFENGAGPVPTASNVTVLDANTITASVTIKKGGSANRDRTWDVRVGTAVLPSGFTVLP